MPVEASDSKPLPPARTDAACVVTSVVAVETRESRTCTATLWRAEGEACSGPPRPPPPLLDGEDTERWRPPPPLKLPTVITVEVELKDGWEGNPQPPPPPSRIADAGEERANDCSLWPRREGAPPLPPLPPLPWGYTATPSVASNTAAAAAAAATDEEEAEKEPAATISTTWGTESEDGAAADTATTAAVGSHSSEGLESPAAGNVEAKESTEGCKGIAHPLAEPSAVMAPRGRGDSAPATLVQHTVRSHEGCFGAGCVGEVPIRGWEPPLTAEPTTVPGESMVRAAATGSTSGEG